RLRALLPAGAVGDPARGGRVLARAAGGAFVRSEVKPMPCLVIDRVSKSFGGVKALDAASFSLEAGELVGLIGPNRSGKPTLTNSPPGALAADSGSVSLGGEPISGLRPEVLARRGVLRMFQLTRAFPRMSALDNLLVAGCALGLSQPEAHARALGLIED